MLFEDVCFLAPFPASLLQFDRALELLYKTEFLITSDNHHHLVYNSGIGDNGGFFVWPLKSYLIPEWETFNEYVTKTTLWINNEIV